MIFSHLSSLREFPTAMNDQVSLLLLSRSYSAVWQHHISHITKPNDLNHLSPNQPNINTKNNTNQIKCISGPLLIHDPKTLVTGPATVFSWTIGVTSQITTLHQRFYSNRKSRDRKLIIQFLFFVSFNFWRAFQGLSGYNILLTKYII